MLLESEREGRGQIVIRRILAWSDRIVEDPEPAAHRGLLIVERSPRESEARIDVLRIHVIRKYMSDGRERAVARRTYRRRIHDRIQRMPHAHGVRRELPSQPDVQRQVTPYFPLVPNIRKKVDLTEAPRRVALIRGYAREARGRTRRECRKIREERSGRRTGAPACRRLAAGLPPYFRLRSMI